jgi:hypothetical protein
MRITLAVDLESLGACFSRKEYHSDQKPGLFMRTLFGIGTPRRLLGLLAAVMTICVALRMVVDDLWRDGHVRCTD